MINSVVWMVPAVTWVGGLLLCHLLHHSSKKLRLRPRSESVALRKDYLGVQDSYLAPALIPLLLEDIEWSIYMHITYN